MIITAGKIKWLPPLPSHGGWPPLPPLSDFLCWSVNCARTPLWKQYGRRRRTKSPTWCCTTTPHSPAHLERFSRTSTTLDSTSLASYCLSPPFRPSGNVCLSSSRIYGIIWRCSVKNVI